MICAGDEIGRSQKGNNNAYSQDNETNWLDWNLDERKNALLEFTAKLVALRREHRISIAEVFQDREIGPEPSSAP